MNAKISNGKITTIISIFLCVSVLVSMSFIFNSDTATKESKTSYIDEGDENPDNYRLIDEVDDGLKAGYRYVKRYNDQYILPEDYTTIKNDNSGFVWPDGPNYEADFIKKIGLNNNLSDYEKVAKIYLYMVWADKHFQYGAAGYFENIGVCRDLSVLFVDLCGRFGIEAVTVTGGAHAWVMVKVENKWYFCDCQHGQAFLMGSQDYYYHDNFENSSKEFILSSSTLYDYQEFGTISSDEFYERFPDIKNNISPTRYTLPATKTTLPKVNVTKKETTEGQIITWDPVSGADYYIVYTYKTWVKDFDDGPYCIRDGIYTLSTSEQLHYVHKIAINEKGKYEFNPFLLDDGTQVSDADYCRFFYVVAYNCNGEMSDNTATSANNTMRSESGNFIGMPDITTIEKQLFNIWCFGSKISKGANYVDKYNGYAPNNASIYRSQFYDKYLLKPINQYIKKHSFVKIRTMITPTTTTKGAILYECENCLQRKVVYQKANANIQANCQHKHTEYVTTKPTCTQNGSENKICSDCYKVLASQSVSKLGHTTLTNVFEKKADLNNKNDYSKTGKCSRCGKTVKTATRAGVKTIKLAKTKLYYNSKNQSPKLIIKDKNGKTLVENKDYTISGLSGKKVGKYKVVVKGKGNFTGKIKLYFTICPKKTTLSKVRGQKKSAIVSWEKQPEQITGYQIQYSLKKNMKGKKTKTIKGTKKTTTIVKNLKSKKKYYFRVRTYKIVKGKKYYSKWSEKVVVKTK